MSADYLIISVYFSLLKLIKFQNLGAVKIVILIGVKGSEEFTLSHSFIFTQNTDLTDFYNHYAIHLDSLRAREYPVDELEFIIVTARNIEHMLNKIVNLDNIK